MVPGSIGLAVAASESRIDLVIQFLLDEPAAAGSQLEFGGKVQVLGTPYRSLRTLSTLTLEALRMSSTSARRSRA